jgi:hypothetical protein
MTSRTRIKEIFGGDMQFDVIIGNPPYQTDEMLYKNPRPQFVQWSKVMSKTARLRIYAYSIADAAHAGLLKIGQTTREVKSRVAEQLKTAAIRNYRIELDEPAEREDGTLFTDFDVREALRRKGFELVSGEWMRCSIADVRTVLAELRTGRPFTGTHHETFGMRAEQRRRWKRLTPISNRSGQRTKKPLRVSCGTRRCASARPSPPISSPKSSAPGACSS